MARHSAQPQSRRTTKTVASDAPSERPSLRDIAREAGVSLGTVSLALRDNPQTSRATRTRIKAIATRMGYRPDPRVAKLMSYLQQKKHRNRDGTIAYLTAFAQRDVWRDSVTWTNYFEGAESKAAELGYRLEHFWMRESGMSEARLSRILHSRGIDGVLIAPVPKSHRKMQLEWDWFSTVAFGYSLQHPRVHRVVHSHFHTTTIVTGELRARGYERIGLVIGPDHDERVANLWSAGFLAFKGVIDPKHAVPLFRGAIEPEPLLKWFRRNRPDAVMSDNLNAAQILDAAGCSVPRDFAFVTLDWLDRTRPFAGVDQHSRDVGAAAAKQLISALQRDERGLPLCPETLMIEGSWVDGESVPAKKSLASVAPPLKVSWLDRGNWQ